MIQINHLGKLLGDPLGLLASFELKIRKHLGETQETQSLANGSRLLLLSVSIDSYYLLYQCSNWRVTRLCCTCSQLSDVHLYWFDISKANEDCSLHCCYCGPPFIKHSINNTKVINGKKSKLYFLLRQHINTWQQCYHERNFEKASWTFITIMVFKCVCVCVCVC